MFTPELIHLAFAAAGLFLGWYAKHKQLPAGLPELLPALEQLLLNQKLQQAHNTLQELAADKAKPPAS
jgi:hypothetical protein